MRSIITAFAVLLFVAIVGAGISVSTATAATTPSPKQAQCDTQRKACYAGKTQEGINGQRYVPPEVVKECEGAYRVCMQKP